MLFEEGTIEIVNTKSPHQPKVSEGFFVKTVLGIYFAFTFGNSS